MVRGAFYEDPPLFASEVAPACGPSIRQGRGPHFAQLSIYLGDQWCVGDWEGLVAARSAAELPGGNERRRAWPATPAEPSQNMKEYDPEWGRAFHTGSVSASCDHERMLRQVRCPVLLTHHAWAVDEATGDLDGAMTGQQARWVEELVASTGQSIEVQEHPTMPHNMHGTDPALYARVLTEWASGLPSEAARRAEGVFPSG
jgi:hypothetical protein